MGCISSSQLLRKAKIRDFSIHPGIEKDIAALHIMVNDSRFTPIVHIVQTYKFELE